MPKVKTENVITLTVREAIGVYNTQQKLPKLPDQKVAYTLGYIADKCEQHIRTFNREREKLRRQMGAPIEQAVQGGTFNETETVIKVPPHAQPEFEDRLEDMLDGVFTVDRAPLSFNALIGVALPAEKQIELTSDQYRALIKVIAE